MKTIRLIFSLALLSVAVLSVTNLTYADTQSISNLTPSTATPDPSATTTPDPSATATPDPSLTATPIAATPTPATLPHTGTSSASLIVFAALFLGSTLVYLLVPKSKNQSK